ncbi:putative aminoadipate reductase [Athelia psychrophila]|uniref:Aminoadipate reductase n=1 Tax=Athelia psychrophila TaxID=1759441 RepID=A0A166EZP8_9AGAM|nr:putative aminoadipate reductase [Fibularhizoctonia sp. CBS 109695]
MSTQMPPVYPPMDGTVRPACLVDFHLEHNPTRPAYVYSEGPGSLVEISFLEFGRAAHRAAHLLRPAKSGPENEVVAFIANVDVLLYQTLVAGMLRAGLVPFPIAPRNSAEAVVSMLEKSACTRILTTSASLDPLIAQIKALTPTGSLRFDDAPTGAQCYPHLGQETCSDPFTPYPEFQTPLALDQVLFYLHSSGSTGFPKPVPQTSRTLLGWCSLAYIVDLRHVHRLGAMHLPPFHTLAINMQLFAPLSGVAAVALYPPTSRTDHARPPAAPTTDSVMEHAKRTGVTAVMAVPSFLEAWSLEREGVEWMKALDFVGYAGGPLARKVGDALSAEGVTISCLYGATEIGCATTLFGGVAQRGPEDWSYVRFDERAHVRWAPQADGTFESQFLDTEVHKLSVLNLPDVRGYASSDLWEPHSIKPGFWRIIGRLDDVLVLASGLNMVPGPLETVIMSSPLVNGVVIFGRGRNQVGVLVEPTPGISVDDLGDDLGEFRNRIWPIVEEANHEAPAYSRIFKEMIIVTESGKPLPRVGKGTVAKKAAMKLYEAEIDALYEAVEAAQSAAEVQLPATWGGMDVEPWLGAQAADINSAQRLDFEADLFAQGFDSLSATFLRNRIMGALRSSSDPEVSKAVQKVTQNVVFTHPTIRQLSAHIAHLVAGVHAGPASAASAIETMIEKYSAGLTGIDKSTADTADAAPVVLLTGSTGGLGSFLLETLLRDTRVERVYAHNRPLASGTSTSQDRQRDAFVDKGFELQLLESERLVYLEGDSALPKLGLSDKVYEELRLSVNLVIHNAWRLDFNLSLASFEPNVRGTRDLIEFASHSKHASALRFLFTSTIGSAQGWDQAKGAFPEEVQYDVSTAVGGGYGEAKYVCERLLAKSGLHATSFRIGQISGGKPSGAWATSDWVPSFVKSSIVLGALPDAQGVASWLPMDVVSRAIMDVALSKEAPSIALNIIHPKPSQWSTVITSVASAMQRAGITRRRLPLVPFSEWFERLEQRSKNADANEIAKIPAIKLLEFFRGMAAADEVMRKYGRTDLEAGVASLSTFKSQAASQTMAEVQPMGVEDSQRWVDYWISKGFFN